MNAAERALKEELAKLKEEITMKQFTLGNIQGNLQSLEREYNEIVFALRKLEQV